MNQQGSYISIYGNRLFRAGAYLSHRARANNTLGFGIHSPFLFNLARAIFPCTCPYYAFARIERLRSGRKPQDGVLPPREAQLLMRLAVETGAKEMLSWGVDAGFAPAYLASVGKDSHVTVCCPSTADAASARQIWQKLELKNVRCIAGHPTEAKLDWQPDKRLDLAYLGECGSGETVLHQFRFLLPLMHPKSLLVMRGIHDSRDMQEAWDGICHTPEVRATMDLFSLGLVFFDPNFERKNYRIRL